MKNRKTFLDSKRHQRREMRLLGLPRIDWGAFTKAKIPKHITHCSPTTYLDLGVSLHRPVPTMISVRIEGR